ncbi:elongation factor P [Erythrobacter sp.]|nr:elongation factor P [Erythrobacter sp.]
MKTRYVLFLTAVAAGVAAVAPLKASDSVDGGKLHTLPKGTYQCALPGDAGGDAFKVVDTEGFRLVGGSTYTSADGKGVYLLRGKMLTFTRGPKKGQQLKRVSTNQLKRGKLTCTRLSAAS